MSLIIPYFNKKCKSVIVTFLFLKVILTFTLSALFSPCGNKETMSTSGYYYNDRKFAYSILILIILTIPMKLLEFVLRREHVLADESAELRYHLY
jgi:hypothetical protein